MTRTIARRRVFAVALVATGAALETRADPSCTAALRVLPSNDVLEVT
jgi:hypothetical protein